MLSRMALDELFDLDMALTIPEPEISVCNNNSHMKPMTDVSFAQIVREMPAVDVVGNVCTVCMESFESSVAAKQVACGHVFHSYCLTNWLSLHNSCPLCRFQVTVSQQIPLLLEICGISKGAQGDRLDS
ncbi:uncharacterized protein LOC132642548 [Lycium barbarum]|uniref:uncharacterized protein LOC132642548 n=1 Tax=Lycium barbarum TaxID=112863 RepID=UPI00293EFEE5|nr:uncharacterized protein LOC132642548 [Lycium barbarum]